METRLEGRNVHSDVPLSPKSKERLEWEKTVKKHYGSKEHVKILRQMRNDYAKYGIKFIHPLLENPNPFKSKGWKQFWKTIIKGEAHDEGEGRRS